MAARGEKKNSPINISLSVPGTGFGQETFKLFPIYSVDYVAIGGELIAIVASKLDAYLCVLMSCIVLVSQTTFLNIIHCYINKTTKQQINEGDVPRKKTNPERWNWDLACWVVDTPRLQDVSQTIFWKSKSSCRRRPKPCINLSSLERPEK